MHLDHFRRATICKDPLATHLRKTGSYLSGDRREKTLGRVSKKPRSLSGNEWVRHSNLDNVYQ